MPKWCTVLDIQINVLNMCYKYGFAVHMRVETGINQPGDGSVNIFFISYFKKDSEFSGQ